MLMEALSAVADELSYYQDRVAGEATLETATQRVSLVRHARLVDYEPSPPIAATTQLQVDVAAGRHDDRRRPPLQRARRRTASASRSRSAARSPTPRPACPIAPTYTVDARWNAGPAGVANLQPYWWDDSRPVPRRPARPALDHRPRLSGSRRTPASSCCSTPPAPTSADPPVRELVDVGGRRGDRRPRLRSRR